jgi:hypothetical protein
MAWAAAATFLPVVLSASARAQQPVPVLLDAMTAELNRAFATLGKTTAGSA